jgi:HEAT repeat protein
MDDIYNNEPFPLEIQILLDDLHSGYVEKFEVAVKNLRDLSDENKQKATAIIKTTLSHPDPERRCDAIELLLLIDPKKNLELVIPLLDDQISYVRLCVCTEFEFNEMYSLELLDPMIKLLLNDSDSDVRYQAAFFLGRIGDERALPALEWAAQYDQGKDYEEDLVSARAKWALQEILSRKSGDY